jgi:hypothetical protein
VEIKGKDEDKKDSRKEVSSLNGDFINGKEISHRKKPDSAIDGKKGMMNKLNDLEDNDFEEEGKSIDS